MSDLDRRQFLATLGAISCRGRLDLKGCVAALRDVGFAGWPIVQLDRVVDPGGTPASAEANREDVVRQLGLAL